MVEDPLGVSTIDISLCCYCLGYLQTCRIFHYFWKFSATAFHSSGDMEHGRVLFGYGCTAPLRHEKGYSFAGDSMLVLGTCLQQPHIPWLQTTWDPAPVFASWFLLKRLLAAHTIQQFIKHHWFYTEIFIESAFIFKSQLSLQPIVVWK